jgi:hypothetical protein
MGALDYLLIAIAVVLYCAWFSWMLTSDKFRNIMNEIWGLYWVQSLKILWPYVLIYAVYHLIMNGGLASTLHTTFH